MKTFACGCIGEGSSSVLKGCSNNPSRTLPGSGSSKPSTVEEIMSVYSYITELEHITEQYKALMGLIKEGLK